MELTLQTAFLAEALTLLILLAGAILLYRSFREKYLVPWLAGWTAYGLAKLFTALSETHAPLRLWTALAYACFVIAVGLFSGSVFLYVYRKTLLRPACLVLFLALVLGTVHALWLPSAALLSGASDLCWRLVLIGATAHLVRFSWGRLNAGRWLLAGMLLLLHNDLAQNAHTFLGYDILVDILLGISMMTIVLDDSRVQIQRLDVLHVIAQQISNSVDVAVTVPIVLEELALVTRAKSAWFRLLEGEKLVLTAHRGLSPAFVAGVATVDMGKSVSGYSMRESEVLVLRSAEAQPAFRQALEAEGIHHIVLVPVEGKSSQIGMLIMGMAHFRVHTENEKQFLKAAARQLGLAAENRNLVRQVAQSQSEWASTFDSIPDCVFVHDLDFRILRANQALLSRLRLSRDQISGRMCEEILPGAGISWKQCPYCLEAEEWMVRQDPCFGGYSMVSTSAHIGPGMARIGAVHVIKDITQAKAAEER